MRRFLMLVIFIFASVTAYADWCSVKSLGSEHKAAICREQREFEEQKEKDAIAARKEAYELERAAARAPKQENDGEMSGNTGIIQQFGSAFGAGSGSATDSAAYNNVVIAKHNLAIEWHAYRFPKMDELDRQMPEQWLIPRSFRYDWYFAKNFGFGLIYEVYKLTNTRDFDPITSNQDVRETVDVTNADGTTGTATREVNKDIPYLFPGAIKSVEYENLWYFVTFNSSLGNLSNWHAVIRFGSAIICNATIEYNHVDLSLDENDYAEQPKTREVSAVQPMFFDFAIERWFEGARASAYIRFTEANNDTTTRLDFVPMGGTTVGVALSTGFPALGTL